MATRAVSETIGIDMPVLVICEGPSDCSFVRAISREYGIGGVDAQCPGEKNLNIRGFQAIRPFLSALSVSDGWSSVMRSLMLIIDGDNDWPTRFAEAAEMLSNVGCVVNEPFRAYPGRPNLAVYIMPGRGRNGCLEHLLIEAVDASSVECSESFSKCLKQPELWPANQHAKMKVHAIMAGSCRNHPAVSLSRVWREPDCPIPIGSSAFGDFAGFLRDFAAL